jgi:hypothetical protein
VRRPCDQVQQQPARDGDAEAKNNHRVVADLMGHASLDQTRRYTLPTAADRERAVNSLLTDR